MAESESLGLYMRHFLLLESAWSISCVSALIEPLRGACWNSQVAGNMRCIGCRANRLCEWKIFTCVPYRADGSKLQQCGLQF